MSRLVRSIALVTVLLAVGGASPLGECHARVVDQLTVSIEGKRHFRSMLQRAARQLTRQEIDALLDTL